MPHLPKISPEIQSFSHQDGISAGDIPVLNQGVREGVTAALSNSKKPEQQEILPENPQVITLSLLRHFPYIDNAAYQHYKKLLGRKIAGEHVPDDEIESAENACDCESDFRKLPVPLQATISKLLSGGKNTLVIYDARANEKFDEKTKEGLSGTGRIFTTIEGLQKQFFVKFHSFDEILPGSDKKAWLLDNQGDLSKNLSKLLSNVGGSELLRGITNIVILSNRSYAGVFQLANKEKSTSMEESIAYLENVGFISYTGRYSYSETSKKMIFNTLPHSIKQSQAKIRAYQKAESIQSRSLEKQSWQGKAEDFVIERKMFRTEEVTEMQDGKEVKTTKEYPIVLAGLFDPSRTGKDGKYVLREHVGNGKSFVLSEVVKSIVADVTKQVIYLEGGRLEERQGNGETKPLSLERMKEIFDEARKNNTIICIDAIDEIRDTHMKELILQQLNNFQGQCFVTARKSEAFSESQFTMVHLKTLDTEVFLRSRFGDGIEGGEKIKQVTTKLTTMNLHTEVAGNPLLLSFVVKLARLSDDDKDKYRPFSILPFEEIQTKTDLYESVTRLTLVEHDMIKGKCSNDKDTFHDKMNNLGRFAYYLFKKEYSEKPSDIPEPPDKSILNALNILFSVDGSGGYSFIHRSFYEFFLARYLVEQGSGNKEICEFRDQKMLGNWNNWREFRPVVMFYGEQLAKEKKWDELVKFLGEDGILKHDDIFGENFFMGLEILYGLPEDVRGAGPMEEVLEGYAREVGEWNIEKIGKRFESIKKFIDHIGYMDTKISDIFLIKIQDVIKKYPHEINHVYEKVLKIQTPKGIMKVLKYAELLIENKKYYSAGNIYTELVKMNSPGAMTGVVRCAELLISEKDYRNASIIYNTLLEIGSTDSRANALKGAELLTKNGAYTNAAYLFRGFTHYGRTEGIMISARCAEGLMNQKERGSIVYASRIYADMMRNGAMEGITGCARCAELLMEIKEYHWAKIIYLAIAKTGTPEAIIEALKGVDLFMKQKEYARAGIIYAKLMTVSKLEGVIGNIRFAELLMKQKEYFGAGLIYVRLMIFNKPDGLKGSIKCAELLMKQKQYFYARVIYEEIMKIGEAEGILGSVKCAELLLKEKMYLTARKMYAEIMKYREIEGILGSIRCAMGLIKEKDYLDVRVVYGNLMKSEHPHVIKGAVQLAELLTKQKQYFCAREIYVNLVKMSQSDAKKEALRGAKLLMKNRAYLSAGLIYVELMTFDKSKGLKGSMKCAEMLVKKKMYNAVRLLYKELMTTGNLEGIKGSAKYVKLPKEKIWCSQKTWNTYRTLQDSPIYIPEHPKAPHKSQIS